MKPNSWGSLFLDVLLILLTAGLVILLAVMTHHLFHS